MDLAQFGQPMIVAALHFSQKLALMLRSAVCGLGNDVTAFAYLGDAVMAHGDSPVRSLLEVVSTQPAHGHDFVSEKLEATTGFEPVMGVLQTPALPLGYVALPKRLAAAARGPIRIRPRGGGRGACSQCGAEEEI